MATAIGEASSVNPDTPEDNGDKALPEPTERAAKAPIIGDAMLTAAGVKGGDISFVPRPPGLPKIHVLFGLPKPPRIKGMADTY
jgi:hypothetical protein